MTSNLNELIKLMAEHVSPSDIVAAEQLAKISATIAKKRIELGMNQTEFAKFMGVSQGMISKWESEDYNFSVEALAKISEKLNLELDISMKPQLRRSRYPQNDSWDFSINGKKVMVGV